MSIFGKKESCMVCNKLGAKVAIFNGFICKECYDKSYDYLSNSVDISQRRVREIEDARLYSANKNKGNKEIKIVASELNIHSNLYNSIYGTVKELMQFLESTINSENNSLESSSDDIDFTNELSTVDEILKIEGLLDSGIITQDEFDKIQSRILGF